jgi:recombination protein RecA
MSPLPLGWRITVPPELLSTGIPDVDAALGGCPRGRITEIVGPPSSGRTSLLHSILAASTHQGEVTVLVDTTNAFDPCSASAAGVDLAKMIWIRCSGNAEHALRAADLVIQSGGFGVVALDLADAKPAALARIPPTAWFRFRRALESTPTVLVVLAGQPVTKSCSALLVEMKRRRAVFSGKKPFELFRGSEYDLLRRKPVSGERKGFLARELWTGTA